MGAQPEPIAEAQAPEADRRQSLLQYLRGLTTPRVILWCYAIWYGVVLVRYFDPNPHLWLTSLGLSVIVGVALWMSTAAGLPAGTRPERWSLFRLFLMPFCVSSFAALVKGQNFFLIFSPHPSENLMAAALIAAFATVVILLRRCG